ncbi:MAG: hypothetical protein K1000chlam1_01246 [Candidatus Anoxychlamydiales bacterium]|nr:hypothetical protein [Candidatus Anoxychlamydiales bacterium]
MEKELVAILGEFFHLLARIDKRLERLEELENEKISKPNKKERLIPLSKWNDYHDYPTIGALRHLAFYRHKNGADKFIRNVGRRLLICEKRFFEWVDGKK